MTGWAATNTVREALERISLAATDDGLNVYEELHLLPTALAKIALVETALDAADELVGLRMDDFDRTYRALAAALRAVREGVERGCAACEGDPEAHGLHVCDEGA